ncbi:MAG: GDSL-type esterase/lipase family protein [Melioribacteraceae bacterium]|nr:GDSL-type esterase/lipase family protein [Melioribacteraceae bacterium]
MLVRVKTILLAILFLMVTIPVTGQVKDYQEASGVLGQTDFVSKVAGTSATTLNGPNGVGIDPVTGKIFVVDRSNHRILRWSTSDAMVNGSAAEAVFGQSDFTSKTTGTAADKFNNPIGIYIDMNGSMWVGDFTNNRVLRFDNAATIASGASADGVLGQPDFVSKNAGKDANQISGPCGIYLDFKGSLWVSEFNNHRVTRWDNAASKANGANADAVLGQPDFATNSSGLSAAKMANPNGLYVDFVGNLWVSDYGNNRFLKFTDAKEKANGADADVVLGQPDFVTKTSNTTRSGSGSTRFIWGDRFGSIYTIQESNNRILVYFNAMSKTNGADADAILGQPDYETKTILNPPTAASLSVPRAMVFDNFSDQIWVADYSNNRVLRFDIGKEEEKEFPQIADNQEAASVLGQLDLVSKASGTSATTLNGPNGVGVDQETGKVFVVDRSNHRILRYSSGTAVFNGSAAEAVFGQADFSTKVTGTSANQFNNPIGIYIDKNGSMWVGDFTNNRVLRFDMASYIVSGASANGVLGQPDFVSKNAGKDANQISGPCGIYVDDNGTLWVSEFNNHRVTRWDNAANKANGANADAVLGQPDFATNSSGLSASKMANPNSAYVDKDGNLWVSDYGNNRFLKFSNAAGKANGADADGVLCQPDFVTKASTTTKNGSGTTRFIWGDSAGRIYTVQENNHRILIFNDAANKANGADADGILGQGDFVSKVIPNPPTASGFNVPRAMYIDEERGNIWVADYSNSRVLRFIVDKQTGAFVKLTSPNGNEEWGVGSTQEIKWSSFGVDNVKIEYTLDGTTWIELAVVEAALGKYEWTLPTTETVSAKVRISNLTNATMKDVSDEAFKIMVLVGEINVVSPNGYQEWDTAAPRKILYMAENVQNVKIEYSYNNGNTWNKVIDSTPATGEYAWTTAAFKGNQYIVRVSSVEEPYVNDKSDHTFSLVTPNTQSKYDYVFFSDSPTKGYYDPSWGYANAPSNLYLLNGSKAPVTSEYSLAGNYSIMMNWLSQTGGDWGLAVAGIDWPGRDLNFKDTLSISVFSQTATASADMPLIYLEDLGNQKTDRLLLSNYSQGIPANKWTEIIIPLKDFIAKPGKADVTRIKTIFFGQDKVSASPQTWFMDEVRMKGSKIIDNENTNTIVVIGSSTAAGAGATTYDSSWVARYKSYVKSKDINAQVVNLAIGGYTTYDLMPTGFAPPSGRPTPKVNNNITFGMTFKPDAIIVNLPSNDVTNGYTIKEQMDNYRVIAGTAKVDKVPMWVTTTQPRNLSAAQMQTQKDVRDSVLAYFKDKAINVFDELANADGTVKSKYNSGDGVHINNAGHRFIFNEMVKAGIWEDVATDVEIAEQVVIPTDFGLMQNYPNPFNPTTTIRYAIPVSGMVDLRIYDILGREVASIQQGLQDAGNYNVTWNASNLSSGFYVYRIMVTVDGQSKFAQSKKMILMK